MNIQIMYILPSSSRTNSIEVHESMITVKRKNIYHSFVHIGFCHPTMKCLHFALHRTNLSIGSCPWLLLLLAKLCDIETWHCKLSSQTHLLLGNLDLHTKRNLNLRFCHPTLKCLHSAFHRTIFNIGTWEWSYGLCSCWPRHLRKETCAKVVGPHSNQVELKLNL